MTSRRDSETLTRVGPGTPMGELMRQYWIPALKSSELAADGDPVRLMLLGEKLIAFRDSSGRVGIMDHRCPHRCASLFFGRNEEGGIRCVYHGWKFDAEGNCLEMPNVPPHQDFRRKVRAKAYKTAEQSGLVWVYMGARAEAPALPAIEPALLPESELRITMIQRDCNWLQALEGEIDTSHFAFLHFGSVEADDLAPDALERWNVADRAPDYEVAETPWGTMYGAFRDIGAGRRFWRVAHFLFPFWTMPPSGEMEGHVMARAWVPLDDSHTMFVQLMWTRCTLGARTLKDGSPIPGSVMDLTYLPNTTDWLGRFRLAANAGNDYRIDRALQRRGSFTGIAGVPLQDQAMCESMGPITDHGLEHLGPSDRMITRTRRRILKAVAAFRRDGTPPPGAEEPEIFRGARSGDFVSDGRTAFADLYRARLAVSEDPAGVRQAAE